MGAGELDLLIDLRIKSFAVKNLHLPVLRVKTDSITAKVAPEVAGLHEIVRRICNNPSFVAQLNKQNKARVIRVQRVLHFMPRESILSPQG